MFRKREAKEIERDRRQNRLYLSIDQTLDEAREPNGHSQKIQNTKRRDNFHVKYKDSYPGTVAGVCTCKLC